MYQAKKLTSFQDLELPSITYKYRRWGNADHKRMLSHAEIHFSRPLDMDGGSELKYRVANQQIGDWHLYYKSIVRKHFPDATEEELIVNATNMMRDMLDEDKKRAPILIEEIIQEHNEEWGALPLGATPTNSHLWEFFAQSGTGFSVGIVPKKIVTGPLFWGGDVLYYSNGMAPEFRFPSVDKQTYSTDTTNVLLSLPQSVADEREYRIYKYGPGSINCEKEAIQEVIVGYAMPQKTAKELAKIVATNLPDAKIYKSEKDAIGNKITITHY